MKPRPVDMFEGEEAYRPPAELLEGDADDVGGLAACDMTIPDFGPLDFGGAGADDEGTVRVHEQLDMPDADLIGKPRKIVKGGGLAAKNAATLAETLHAYGPSVTRCILRGTFIFGDLIMEAANLVGPCHARIVTLSLNDENVDALYSAFKRGDLASLDLITSDFFHAHYRHTLWRMLVTNLPRERTRYAVCRTHAKVALLEPLDASKPGWCIEGSANLRSSDNLEQITVSIGDPEAHRFHGKWMDRVMERFNLYRANVSSAAAWAAIMGD